MTCIMINHNPLAPENLEISQNMLSKYMLFSVVHYRNLPFYLSLGMKSTKIDRVLKSKQSDSLKKFIDFNTDRRKNAANSFFKELF